MFRSSDRARHRAAHDNPALRGYVTREKIEDVFNAIRNVARSAVDRGLRVYTIPELQRMNLPELIKKHGATSKLVRAVCAAQGWHWTPNGAPAAWYQAWRAGLGQDVEDVLAKDKP